MAKRYVIIGGVAGGATAAARLRRRDEHAEIVILERGPYVSFANCGLPYYVSGVIAQREALLVSTPERLCEELRVDVRTRHEVTAIDRAAQSVRVRDLDTGETYSLPYDRLILSPGAAPIVPPVPGVDLPGVYTLRSIPDTDAIKARVDAGDVRRAVVVGGGFIGLEMVEALVARGVEVTVVEMLDQVLAPLDAEMAALVHQHLRQQGVRLLLSSPLRAIACAPDGTLEVHAGDEVVGAELVMLALGVRPENALAREAGLALGARGHIVVDEHLRTSDPAIYAVGDAVEVTDPVTHTPYAVPLAGPANRQARIAADHITGREDARYGGTWGTSIVKVFDLTVATTGANARTLRAHSVPFAASVTHSADHVAYYPGATQQSVKLLYTPEGRLLGAQVVGYRAVDRTIGVLATALQAGLTVYDLENLELAYAPPYGAAKDPVNIAGYVAGNALRGDARLVEWRDVPALLDEGYGLLDVRSSEEFALGHLPGAVNVPLAELRSRLGELDKAKKWIVYCKVGRRAYLAERILRQHGFDVQNVTGGYTTYAPVALRGETGPAQAPGRPPAATPGASAFGATPGSGAASGTSVALATGVAPASPLAHASPLATATLDASGLQCPGPIMAVYRQMQDLQEGQILAVRATDPGFGRDVAAWCERTGNTLVDVRHGGGAVEAWLQKGVPGPLASAGASADSKTIVVFSGDLDRALAAFVIANGALAMGQHVTLFFTFWGLNVVRKDRPQPVQKNIVERMLGWMLPRGADRLRLSQLHMAGLGTWMIKQVMRQKRIDPLPALIAAAREQGARLIACQMSMDMMGIRPEELLDGVEVGGVATYIAETDKGNASLFI